MTFFPGQRVVHAQFGEGVIVALFPDGRAQVFFPSGECRVLVDSLRLAQSREEAIIGNVVGSPECLRDAWLHVEAHALPLLDNAAALSLA